MSRCLFLCAVAGLAFGGCGKKPTEPAPVIPASVPVQTSPNQSPNSPASPPAVSPATAPATFGGTVDIAALNRAVQKYWKDKKSPPYTLDDLVRAGYVQSIGTPPTGKAIFYNNETVKVTLVNQ